ncbi:ABC transporter permease [Lewinella sp. LCG006]|uniref:ABC transporter permease n=1 Tax=Lewinella sp. LCG006 TaxID=3231911 RepID=UPI00346095EA
MFIQYLKLALRNFRSRPGYSFIHLFGLATGMAACLLLLQYVSFELSFDRFHTQADQIYRVVNERFQNGESVQRGTITYPTIAPTLLKDYPEVTNATRFFYGGGEWFSPNQADHYHLDRCYFTDPNFLEIFDFPILAAANDSLLANSREVVLTAKYARDWYSIKDGNYNQVLGKEIVLDGAPFPFKVVGVMEDSPINSHLQIEVLVSYATIIEAFGEDADNSWTWSDFYHYVVLAPGTDVLAFEDKLKDFSERYFRGDEVSGSNEVFTLQPLLDAHLKSSDLEYEMGKTANGKSIWALLIIAFFILLIAWINYANLTASRALERAKEVGLRKVVGASHQQLIHQFFTEALLANVLSFALATGLVFLIQPFAHKKLQIDLGELAHSNILVQYPRLWGTAAAFCLLGLALSAFYPSWILSNQKMAAVLKGSFTGQGRGRTLRQGLIVFQFATSIGLIAGTLLVYRQINFLQKKDLGVNIDQIMLVQAPELTRWDSTFIERMDVFKAQLTELPGIQEACTASRAPGEGIGRVFGLTLPAAADDRNHTFGFIQADHSYTKTYGLEILAGRSLRPEDHSPNIDEINSLLINEEGVKTLGFKTPEEVIGQVVNTSGKEWTIVGVIPNFHQLSLHHPISPLLIQPFYGTSHPIAIRLAADRVASTLPQVEALYNEHFPGNTFQHSFLDERFAQQYTSDRQFGQILLFFTLLTIVVACLGLVGLAAYAAQLRTKEISIRKILGAGTSQLVLLLSGGFMKLILIAVLIGLPLAWWGVKQWLNNYAYRVDFAWWQLPLAALLGLGLAFLTVSYYGLRAAWVNPAEQLRGE